MPPQIDFSKYGLAQPTPTAGQIDFSKYGLNKSNIPTAPAISASRQADIETAQKYGSTFTPSTENQGFGIGEAIKTVGNIPKSAYNFAKGAIDLINPVSTFGKVKQAVSEFKGLAGETGGYGKALGALGKELPQATYEGLVPEATRGLITAGKGFVTGNEADITQGLETAQRTITADPFGQIAPFVFGVRGVASIADSFANKASMADYVKNIETNIAEKKPIPQPVNTFGNMFDQGVSKVASPVLNTITGAFGKIADITGKGVKFGVGQEFGLEPKTVSRIIEKPEAFAPETRGAFTREALGSKVEKALAERTTKLGITPESLAQEIETGLTNKNAKLGITPEMLGQEIQSALNMRTSALSETGAGYGPIRESKVAVKVSPNWIDSTIKDLTGLKIEKGAIKTSGSAILRDSSDVRAMQNLYDVWKPEFKKGKLTTDEFLNFRTDLAKISKFERQIGKSQPLESMAKLARGRFNESYRPQLTGLEAIDKEFSAQTKSLRELSKGLVDKNGKLTDTGLAKIAKTTKEKPNVAKQLEAISPGIIKKIEALNEQKTLGKGLIDESGNITDRGIRQIANADPQIQPALLKRLEAISPGITKKITALKEIKQLGKGLIDDSGNITDLGMGRIANAINESNPLMLQRLEKLVPGIAEEIKNYKAASDIEAARGNKVGTYSRSTIGAGAYYLLAHDPIVAAGLWLVSKYFLTNPDVGVWMLRKYGSAKSSTIVNLIRSVGNTINQLPNQRPPILKKDIKEIKVPAGLSIEDVSKGKPQAGKTVEEFVNNQMKDNVYHGTKSSITSLKEVDVLQYGKPDALYGQGLYLTDNPKVAEGYSVTKGIGETGKVLNGRIKSDVNLLNLDEKLTPEISNVMEKVINQGNEGAKLSFKGKDGQQAMKEFMSSLNGLPKSEASDVIDSLHYNLEQLGYDGFRHTGGKITRGVPSNISILWDGGKRNAIDKVESILTKSQLIKAYNEAPQAKMTGLAKDIAEAKGGAFSPKQQVNFNKKDFMQKQVFRFKTHDNYMKNKYVGYAEASGLNRIGIGDQTIKWLDDWLGAKQTMPPTEAMQQLSKYKPKDPITLYSGNSMDQFKISRIEPTSFTSDLRIAKTFADIGRRDNPAIIKIEKVNPNDVAVAIDMIPKEIMKTIASDKGFIASESEIITNGTIGDLVKKYKTSISKDGGISWTVISGKSNFGRELATPKTGAFSGFKDLTTQFLEYVKGKTTLSRQEIMDFARRPELKKGEADLLLKKVEGTSKIPAQEFADSIRRDLLELKPVKVKSPEYESRTVDGKPKQIFDPNIQTTRYTSSNKNYEEVVFESPITTNGSSHYPNSKNYFAHARGDEVVESGKKIWREQEIQSDLLQKEGMGHLKFALEKEKGNHKIGEVVTKNDKEFVITQDLGDGKYKAVNAEKLDEYASYLDNPERATTRQKINAMREQGRTDLELPYTTGKEASDRLSEISKLDPFTNDRFGERIMRERIKAKAQAGYEKYRLPTGETIGKIEGFETSDWDRLTPEGKYLGVGHGDSKLTIENMKVGQMVMRQGHVRQGDDWIITDILGDGRFKAVPKDTLKRFIGDQSRHDIKPEELKLDLSPENLKEAAKYSETFDLTGKSNPQYRRYSDWGKFLKNKFGGKEVIDPQGNSWMEIDLKKEQGKLPVPAFGMKTNDSFLA